MSGEKEVKCPCRNCNGTLNPDEDGNFDYCEECGFVVYKCARNNEPSWVANYWRQILKEWKKES